LVAFPELALSGYPPEDLVLKPHFLEDVEVELRWLARELPPGLTAVVGAPRHAEGQTFNAAVVFQGGREILTYRKMLLPNYGVFDEKRVFAAGTQPGVIEVGGLRIGLHICEDSWYVDEAPCQLMAKAGVDAVLNISALPPRQTSPARTHPDPRRQSYRRPPDLLQPGGRPGRTGV
jgi:NAD+ synthase (glutamine-hydrolysing)